MALTILAATGVPGLGLGFQEVPPTHGAYTLRGGEWQIGLPYVLAPLAVSVEYGITDHVQIGVAPILAALGYLNLGGKLRIPLGPSLDMGVPFGVGLYPDPIGFIWSTGAVLSLGLGGGFTVHGGVGLGMVQQLHILPYAIADFDLLPNLKLVGELGLMPVSLAIGAWVRVLPFLDVKLALNPLVLSFTGGLYLRF